MSVQVQTFFVFIKRPRFPKTEILILFDFPPITLVSTFCSSALCYHVICLVGILTVEGHIALVPLLPSKCRQYELPSHWYLLLYCW